MEKGLEVSVSRLYVLKTLCKILYCRSEVHKTSVNQSPVKVIKPILWFHGNCFMKLSQSVIDLVKHHHAVASVRIVLWIICIESDSSSEVVHCFLIMAYSHKGLSSL